MYRRADGQVHIFDCTQTYEFKLDSKNRWVKWAASVTWALVEERYAAQFDESNGRPAHPARMALGALVIQQAKGLSDEETLLEITESPYLQYFIGLKEFTNEPPFDPSMMVHFRKRFTAEFMAEINEAMCKAEAMPKDVTPPDDDDDEPHGGTLILDATCAPADIKYPTDTGLLADAIEKTDAMIDTLHEPFKGTQPRPRTYRVKSRKLFTGFVRQRKPGKKVIRKVKGKQLHFLRRNLAFVEQMLQNGGQLSDRQMKLLATIRTLYEQQKEMFLHKTNRVDDRVVSISQPHIRPIVRGKAGTPVEFGAKINMSVVNGYVFLNEISYDAFHEGTLLENAIIDYYTCFHMLPAKILADQAFTTRENRKLCKELGIQLAGKPLGRPPKHAPPADKKDIGRRSEVEGKFGTLKTRYGWERIMPRLPETGMASIAVSAFTMNLAKRAQALLRLLFLRRHFRACA
jgi:hypothetical protein